MLLDTNDVDTTITIQIVDDTGLPVTGLVASTFPTIKFSSGTGADVTVTLSDLSALTDAHSDGGVKERGEGYYRLDLPDSIATSAGEKTIRGETTDKRVIADRIVVAAKVASVSGAVGSVTGAVGSVTGNLGGNVVGNVNGSVNSVTTGVTLAADSITSTALAISAVNEIQSGLSTLDAAGVRTALGMASANLDLQLGAIDDFLDTEIAAIKAKTDNLPADPADASDVATAFTIVNNTLSVLSSKIDTVDDLLDTEIAAIKTTTDRLETTWVLDGSVYQFTANALELAPSASGSGDWTSTEKEQIRYRLGLDGTESAPSSNTPSLGTVNAHVVSTATGVTLPDDTADTPTEINIYAGVDKTVILSVSVTSTWSKAIFTVKHNTTQIDSASVIQLVVSNPGDAADGLRYLLGSSATAAQGSLSVNHSTDQITVFLSAAAKTQFTKSYTNLSWDVKVIYDDGTIPQLMSAGQCNVHRLPGRSLS